MNKIFVARTQKDLERCFPVMKELRAHLEMEDYLSIYREAHRADGYEIVAIEQGGAVVAIMGYRILSDFVRGRHIYIDDLVSTQSARSSGLGAELLKYAEEIASKAGCAALRLCTGIENEGGIRFYERNGWTKRAFAYTKKV
ncbi:MAG: GNAT family N-acetyltransferase [Bdellovibrionales bacterium]|nr:GNAT family N-acetyltransferase [Bdellovibrionales bacterium]